MIEKIDHWIMWALGSHTMGGPNIHPPGDGIAVDLIQKPDPQNYRFGHRAVTTNDGYELMFCYTEGGKTEGGWLISLTRGQALQLAWWIIFRWWIVGNWCGLRRWLYYAALSRVCRRRERKAKEVKL